jgi:hydroxymethylpyrimidine pyrophosphatase-like HAD family hydrolase
MPDTQFVGLTHEGVTKGSAIRSVAEGYGISLQEVMYVGDAGNDLSALRIVGHPIAMGNADPAVIEAAAYTVGHVNQGGLAQALEMAVNRL